MSAKFPRGGGGAGPFFSSKSIICVTCLSVILSVPYSFVVTCWERANLLALLCDFSCGFIPSRYGVQGQVWYLIISISDLCLLLCFELILSIGKKCIAQGHDTVTPSSLELATL